MPNGSDTKFDITLKLINSLGFPVVFSLILIFGLWKSAVWISTEVVKPMTGGYIQTLTVVQDSIKSQAEILKRMADDLDQQLKTSEQRTQLLKDILAEQTRTSEHIKTLSEKMRQ